MLLVMPARDRDGVLPTRLAHDETHERDRVEHFHAAGPFRATGIRDSVSITGFIRRRG